MPRLRKLIKSWFEKLITGSYPVDSEITAYSKLSLSSADREALRKLEEELYMNEPDAKALL